MSAAQPTGPTLRMELFVHDVPAALDFYRRVLGFVPAGPAHEHYQALVHGAVRLAINQMADLPVDHPLRAAGSERTGLGIELVLEVDDVEAARDRAATSGWPVAAELQERPWGLTDFRLCDPDGYYWRVTSRRAP